MGLAGAPLAHAGVATHEVLESDAAKKWSFSISDFTYLVPDDKNYTQPTLTADHDWFHFEARYNYEGLQTGSAWLGYNLGGGEKITWEFTPMAGAVFGLTRGVAPGCRLTLEWNKLAFYSETEYVIDVRDTPANFLYTWLELTYAPWDWLRAGLVAQRTRDFESGLGVDRGVLVALTWRQMDFTTCVFNVGWEKPTVVLGVALHF
jgi:hypothetical protein